MSQYDYQFEVAFEAFKACLLIYIMALCFRLIERVTEINFGWNWQQITGLQVEGPQSDKKKEDDDWVMM